MEAAEGATAHADTQRPKRAALTIVRPLRIQPAAAKAHVVVEAARLEGARAMQKSGASAGQSQHGFLIFSQFTQHHREDEGPRIIVGAIAFRKIWDAEI